MGKYDYYKLKGFIRRATKDTSIEEISEQTGLDEDYLNDLIYAAYMDRPSIKSLELLVPYMENVEITDLLDVCDYDMQFIEDKVNAIESMIYAFFMIRKGDTWTTMNLKRFINIPQLEVIRDNRKIIENVTINWHYDIYSCQTRFKIKYSRDTGKVVIESCDIYDIVRKRGKIVPHTTVTEKFQLC